MVAFRDLMQPAEAARHLRAADALLVPLDSQPGLEKFVPSKLFDCCAIGRPVVVAAAGEPTTPGRGVGGRDPGPARRRRGAGGSGAGPARGPRTRGPGRGPGRPRVRQAEHLRERQVEELLGGAGGGDAGGDDHLPRFAVSDESGPGAGSEGTVARNTAVFALASQTHDGPVHGGPHPLSGPGPGS